MTQLHAGGKFGDAHNTANPYKVSGGLHGVGVSVVNALSSWLKLTIWRDGKEHFIEFRDGEALAPLSVVGAAHDKRGTEVTFLPSPQTFTMTEFDFATLDHRLRELAFLNSGVMIVLSDKRHAVEKREEMRFEGGVEAFVRYIDRNQTALVPAPIMIRAERDGIAIECALWWNESFHETVLCFTNTIPQRDGGTHLAGFRGALTRQVTSYAERGGAAQKERMALTGDDCREGTDGGPFLQGAGPEVLLPDQGQARLVGGAAGGREPRQRGARNTGSRSIHARPGASSTRWSTAAAAREAARKARDIDPAQGSP